MTQNDYGELVCLLVTVVITSSAIVYLVWHKGRRRFTRFQTHARCVSWCVAVLFPVTMYFTYFDACWPYGYDYSPSQHRFRWGLLVRDSTIGLLLAFILGNAYAISQFKQESKEGVPLIEAGPLWADRPSAASRSNDMRRSDHGTRASEVTEP